MKQCVKCGKVTMNYNTGQTAPILCVSCERAEQTRGKE